MHVFGHPYSPYPSKHNGVAVCLTRPVTRKLSRGDHCYLRNRRKIRPITHPKWPQDLPPSTARSKAQAGPIICTRPIPETRPSHNIPSPYSGWVRPRISEPPSDAMALRCLSCMVSPGLLVGLWLVLCCSDDCFQVFSADSSGAVAVIMHSPVAAEHSLSRSKDPLL